MAFPSARPAGPARAMLLLALAAAGFTGCGTRGDDTLGVSLIEDRGDRKAVRFVSLVADSGAAFQSGTQAGDPAAAPTMPITARPGYLSRALLRFPPSALPGGGVSLDSATVVLPYRDGFGDTSFTLAIHRVLEDWSEVTMPPDSFPAYDAVPAVTLTVPFPEAALDTFNLSLTALAQAWSDDSTTNFGVALLPAAGEEGELELDARQSTTPPILVVYWTASGADSVRGTAPSADLYALGTTPGFVPLSDQPRRVTVARGVAARSFLRFPWEDPGVRATVHRAELTLHGDPSLSAANGFAVGVRRILAEPWNGFATEVDPTILGIQTVVADQDSVVLDVTQVVIDLLDAENHGFEIRPADERPDTDYLRFHGWDTETPALAPTLRVWWTPGDAPEGTP